MILCVFTASPSVITLLSTTKPQLTSGTSNISNQLPLNGTNGTLNQLLLNGINGMLQLPNNGMLQLLNNGMLQPQPQPAVTNTQLAFRPNRAPTILTVMSTLDTVLDTVPQESPHSKDSLNVSTPLASLPPRAPTTQNAKPSPHSTVILSIHHCQYIT
jgi:hypothetical protein